MWAFLSCGLVALWLPRFAHSPFFSSVFVKSLVMGNTQQSLYTSDQVPPPLALYFPSVSVATSLLEEIRGTSIAINDTG